MELKCPICKKLITWKGNPHRPFCSEKCKMIDLGYWASEQYRIVTDSLQQNEETKEESHYFIK